MTQVTTKEKLLHVAVLLLAAVSGVMHFAHTEPISTFVVTALALSGVAWVVSFATEQLGESFGPAVTGLLQSTLGNLPEFFIVLFALSAGEVVIAQTSIIGSILGNALLILGLTIVVGARRAEGNVMRFHPKLPQDTSTLLLLSVFIIALIGIFQLAHSDDRGITSLSVIGALALLFVYVSWVIPYVKNNAPGDPRHDVQPRLTPRAAGIVLAVAGVGAALVSDWFVSALRPAIEVLNISEVFAGLIIVAIAGNAVENTTAIVLAHKGQTDLAISVVKNSVSQIAAFLFPALVLVSMLFATPMTFAMAPIYIGALLLSAVAVWQITGDGQAAFFEGAALISLYLVVAGVAFFS